MEAASAEARRVQAAMRGSEPLRYYPSALRALLLLPAAGAFVAAGVLIVVSALGHPILVAAFPLVLGSAAILVFGIGMLLCVAQIFSRVFHRAAWLMVDSSGIASDTYGWHRFMAWDQVREIAIYGARYREVRPRRTEYFLVVSARDGEEPPKGLEGRINTAFFPWWRSPAVIVPLNALFIPCTRVRRRRLLDQIRARFGSQIAAYGITLDEREHVM